MEVIKLLTMETYTNMLNRELLFNEWVQERLSFGEPLWSFMSIYLDPSSLFNLFIPLCGIYSQELLMHLLAAISLMSTLNSFGKWIYPEVRPLWWLRERFADDRVYFKPPVALESHQLSCETSGGLPCAHSMAFTLFVLIVASFLFVHFWNRYRSWRSPFWRCLMYPLIFGLIVCMWLSRLFLATEFLHQCVVGSFIGLRLLNCFEGKAKYLYSCSRLVLVSAVCVLGGVAVAVYFIKLRFDLDPHWSVRQAFKWCPEPTYMRHEASTIFLLARDLGNLMGMALASPLCKLPHKQSSFLRRCSVLGVLELLNYVLRLGTPKQRGRFAFLAYEFSRNALHSLILLKYSTKFY